MEHEHAPPIARDGFWAGVEAADAILRTPSLEGAWDDASALPELTTGALAAHLVRAVGTLATYASSATGSVAQGPGISAAEYFVAVIDDPADLWSPVNQGVRQRSRDDAAPGHAAVLERWRQATSTARQALDTLADDHLLAVAAGLVLTLDQYLRTRIVELVVHTDDLALSLGLEPPTPAPEAAGAAVHTLLDVARLRHGELGILRAMSRRDRQGCDVLQVF